MTSEDLTPEEQKRRALFDHLRDLWREYYDYYIVGNKELCEIWFHVFMGIVLTWQSKRYMESSKHKTTRLHIFVIQDSGTGKSEMMKALEELVKYMKIPVRLTVKDNEASLTGTVYKDKDTKEIVKRKGLLHTLYAILWDEGSVLIKHSSYMDVMTDYFQMVMDEPGRIVKGMRLGSIEYDTNCTVIAGSYMFDEFKETLMKKGFMQRMFISYKRFTEHEKREIRIGVNLKKLKINPDRIEKIRKAIADDIAKMPDIPENLVYFNSDTVKEFNNDLETVFNERFVGQFVGEKQDILETFYNRLHILVDKIAAQRAMIMGHNIVNSEDMHYALELVLWHVDSLLTLFDQLRGGKITTTGNERVNVILRIMEARAKKVVQSDLMAELKKLKSVGHWDLGYNRTLELLKTMEDSKLIHTQQMQDKNKKLLIMD